MNEFSNTPHQSQTLVTLRKRTLHAYADVSDASSKARAALASVSSRIVRGARPYIEHDPMNDTSSSVRKTWKRGYVAIKVFVGVTLLGCAALMLLLVFESHYPPPNGTTASGMVLVDNGFGDILIRPKPAPDTSLTASIHPLSMDKLRQYDIAHHRGSAQLQTGIIRTCDAATTSMTCDAVREQRLYAPSTDGNSGAHWKVPRVTEALENYLRANAGAPCACARFHGVCGGGSYMVLRQGTSASSFLPISNVEAVRMSEPFYVSESNPMDPNAGKTVKRYEKITIRHAAPSEPCSGASHPQQYTKELFHEQAFCVYSCLLANRDIVEFDAEKTIEMP